MAWITPEGGIIPITGEDMHSNVAETFPGVPAGEDYPTNYAMDKLGYMKVGNAFDFAYKSGRETPANVMAGLNTITPTYSGLLEDVMDAVIVFILSSNGLAKMSISDWTSLGLATVK
jgi:hypothetical protein